MRALLLGAMAMLGLAIGALPSASTSWSRVPPHKRAFAVCEAGRFTDYINAMWAWSSEKTDFPDKYAGYPNSFVYSDTLGKVGRLSDGDHEYVGEAADDLDLVEALRMSNGKQDQGLLVASRLVLLQRDKFNPVYLLSLRRNKWERYNVLPSMELVEEYEVSDSVWMMQFKGNEFHLLRQAQEMAPMAARGRNLLTQKVDCERLWSRAGQNG